MRIAPFALLLALVLDSRRLVAQPPTRRCDRALSRIAFGTDGGNMRPVRTIITPDGGITRERDTLSAPERLAAIDTTVLRALERLALNGAVRPHRLSSARPLANRDVAYEYIELTSPCASRRAEYHAEEAPARFRDLFALLSAVTR